MRAPLTSSLLNNLEQRALSHVGRSPKCFVTSPAPKKVKRLEPLHGRKLSVNGLPWHIRRDVLNLLDAFVAKRPDGPLRQPKSAAVASEPLPPLSDPKTDPLCIQLRRDRRSTGALTNLHLGRPAGRLPAVDERAKAPTAAARYHIDAAPSFEAVLRVYYRGSSAEEINAMLACAEPALAEHKRRHWVAQMRSNAAEQIRQAFMAGDTNGDGRLDVNEFMTAVSLHRGERDGDGSSATAAGDAHLARIFAAADKNRDGVLDMQEFLDIVSRHPELRDNFRQILALASEQRMGLEDYRTSVLFKQPISPNSHTVRSPSGRRRRPSLFDLRATDEICAWDRLRDIRSGAQLASGSAGK